MTKQGEKHFTASAWILTQSNPKKMLLVHHKKFNKWLQPGGHIEWNENPVEAAIRETQEETGIDISFLLEKITMVGEGASFLPSPEIFMEQKIPAYQDQPEHFHLDMGYVVEVEEQELTVNEHESHDIGWFTREEILKLEIHEDTRLVVADLMR